MSSFTTRCLRSPIAFFPFLVLVLVLVPHLLSPRCSPLLPSCLSSPLPSDHLLPRHRYEVNPEKVSELERSGLKFVGMDETGEVALQRQDQPILSCPLFFSSSMLPIASLFLLVQFLRSSHSLLPLLPTSPLAPSTSSSLPLPIIMSATT
eukprot:761369-Hanusia_phi.AAC.6